MLRFAANIFPGKHHSGSDEVSDEVALQSGRKRARVSVDGHSSSVSTSTMVPGPAGAKEDGSQKDMPSVSDADLHSAGRHVDWSGEVANDSKISDAEEDEEELKAPGEEGDFCKDASESSQMSSEDEGIEWLERATKGVRGRARGLYYAAVRINGERFEIGDCCKVAKAADDGTPDGKHKFFLCQILAMWENKAQEKWMKGMWFYFPEETHLGRCAEHAENEVFRSDQAQDLELSTIDGKVVVLSIEDWQHRGGGTADGETAVYFYQNFYYGPRRVFKTIEDEQTRHWGTGLGHDRSDKPRPWQRGKSARTIVKPVFSSLNSTGDTKKRNKADVAASGELERESGESAIYRRAQSALRVSAVPKKLPCREEQHSRVYEFLRNAMRGGAKRTLYISGVPGTGKTATVLAVLRELEVEAKAGSIPIFRFIELNGMRLSEPHQAYSILNEALTGRREPPKAALTHLQKFISRGNDSRVFDIILCDELDLLLTRKQNLVYNLFNWASLPGSRIAVIGIANTMDLHERLLPKVSSRLGLNHLTFSPYEAKELRTIIHDRLQNLEAFSSDAIGLCVTKVAGVSGDARRALEFCRRAVEFAETEWKVGGRASFVTVSIDHIQRVLSEMLKTSVVAAIRLGPLHLRVLALALVVRFRTTGVSEAPFCRVVSRHLELCSQCHLDAPTISQLRRVADEMSTLGLVNLHGAGGVNGSAASADTIVAQFDEDDVRTALMEDIELGEFVSRRL